MKKELLTGALCLVVACAWAQSENTTNKMDNRLEQLVQNYRQQVKSKIPNRSILKSQGQHFSTAAVVSLTISTHDGQAQTVADAIVAAGHSATKITDKFVVARVPLNYVEQLTAMPEVKNVALSRKHKPLLNKARAATNVDKVRSTSEFTTPFTGKGVVLGVIDQGFQYDHIAFQKEGKSRVVRAWDRSNPKKTTQPSETLPKNETEGSHATHVTGIAAGTDVGNNFGGVAPAAELVLISSSLEAAEVAEDVAYIKKFAETQHKPWVVNMSFGSQMGGHDGTDPTENATSSLTGKGGLITAAMGNEGEQRIHGTEVVRPGETYYLVVEPDVRDTELSDVFYGIWGQSNDGKEHFKFTPMLCVDDEIYEAKQAFWDEALKRNSKNEALAEHYKGIEDGSHKQFFQGYYTYKAFSEKAIKYNKLGANADVQLMLKIELAPGETQPQTFHTWVESGYGHISTTSFDGELMVKGDSEYLCGQGGASIPKAIAVASFNTADRWKAVLENNDEYKTQSGKLHDISSFSSHGPSLDGTYKPTIAAPGSILSSAVNSADSEWERENGKIVDNYITHVKTINNKPYYYGAMEGTSMASPFMAGVLCLWLQANPELDYDDIIHVLKTTAQHDEFAQDKDWNPTWGFGKVDAYAGLKEVLRMAKTTGVERVNNSDAPVSIQKTDEAWRILFNNAERYAELRLFNAEGKLLSSRRMEQVQQGDETVLSFEGLSAGVYLVNLRTASSNTTQRVLVK